MTWVRQHCLREFRRQRWQAGGACGHCGPICCRFLVYRALCGSHGNEQRIRSSTEGHSSKRQQNPADSNAQRYVLTERCYSAEPQLIWVVRRYGLKGETQQRRANTAFPSYSKAGPTVKLWRKAAEQIWFVGGTISRGDTTAQDKEQIGQASRR